MKIMNKCSFYCHDCGMSLKIWQYFCYQNIPEIQENAESWNNLSKTIEFSRNVRKNTKI